MKKLAILTSILALTACGGGSGSAPIMPDAPVVPSETEMVRKSNYVITAMVSVDNESIRTSYVKNVLGDDYYSDVSGGTFNPSRSAAIRSGSTTGNGKNVCKSEKDCNDLAFNNMKNWLIENIDSLDENNIENSADLRKALMLAGFKDELPGNWDDIKAWFFDNKEIIKQQAQDIYDQLGEHEKFNLEDVVFTMSSASLGDEDGGKDELTFDVKENGEISGVDFKTYAPNDQGKLAKADEGDFYAKRTDDKNEFLIHQEREGEVLEGIVAIETYGYDIGLKYSDFGAFVGVINGESIKEGFAGGYTTKDIDVSKISGEMNFAGRVIGTVQPTSEKVDNLPLDGAATLNFNNGTETLSLAFDNWYDVKIEKTGDQGNIHFTNGDVIRKDEHKFATGNELKTDNFLNGNYEGRVVEDGVSHYGKIDINYYGNADKAVEATGVLQYVEHLPTGGGIRTNMAFGTVKK
jgi:hypothetical protein